MSLASHHEQLREAVRRFAAEQLAPNAPAWDRDKHFPREQLQGLAAMGLMGVAIPEEWGGAGMDYTALAIACDEVSAGDGATCTIVMVTNLVANILRATATMRRRRSSCARSRRVRCSAPSRSPSRTWARTPLPSPRARKSPARTTC